MVERRSSVYPLVAWARERESIRKRKAAGLIPWTNDPILSQFRFCNLRRSDDRVSQWLINNVYSRQTEFSPWSFIQFTALCRWVNWPPMLLALETAKLWPNRKLDFKAIAQCIEDRCGAGGKAWTGAFMVRAAPKRDYGDMPKANFVCEVVVEQGLALVQDELTQALVMHRAKPVWEVLYSIKNWGSFMAGQVVADWSYTPLLANAGDICSWAPVGPGSRRGYNRLLRLPLDHPAPEEGIWCARLQLLRRALIIALGHEYVTLTLHDVQNALCEYDKYERVRLGQGRPRSLYKPETAY